jgi:parvulin-like peptidyl-prolyl isomerase
MKRVALFVALASLLLSACGNDLLAPAAAVVNGEKITVAEMDDALLEYMRSVEYEEASERGDPEALQRAFEQDELSRRIFRAVLEPEAEARGIEITDEVVQQQIERIQEDFTSVAQFEEALKEQNLSLERFESLVYDQQLERLLKDEVTADLTPTAAELREFYTDNAQRYIETEVAHIVVASRSEAARIVQQLRKGSEGDIEQRFARFAREESLDTATAASGGELGTLVAGEGDPAFEQVASRVRVGGVSQPVQTDLGWEIILVKDRRPIPFEDVRGDIIDTLAGEERDAAWDEWLTQAYEDAQIEVNPRYGVLREGSITIVDPQTSDLPGTEDVEPTATEAPPAEPGDAPGG